MPKRVEWCYPCSILNQSPSWIRETHAVGAEKHMQKSQPTANCQLYFAGSMNELCFMGLNNTEISRSIRMGDFFAYPRACAQVGASRLEAGQPWRWRTRIPDQGAVWKLMSSKKNLQTLWPSRGFGRWRVVSNTTLRLSGGVYGILAQRWAPVGPTAAWRLRNCLLGKQSMFKVCFRHWHNLPKDLLFTVGLGRHWCHFERSPEAWPD